MTSNSSTSSSRPLGTLWTLAVVVVTTVALNAWVAWNVEKPPDIVAEKVRPYLWAEQGPHVVTFGACHGDAFMPAQSEPAWGGGKVHNLAYKSTTPMEWTMLLSRHVRETPDLRGAVVLYVHGELTAVSPSTEGQIMGLVAWRDMPNFLRTSCGTFDCAAETVLRRAWPAYRQKAYLGARFWNALGVPPLPGGEVPRPPTSAFDAARDPFLWTRAFIQEAHRRGIPAMFIPLPRRPGSSDAKRDADAAAAIAIIEAEGGEILDIPVELTGEDYVDELHLDPKAQPKVARGIGEALRRRL